MNAIVFAACLLLPFAFSKRISELSEAERVERWRQTHTWPPNWQPYSEKRKAFNAQREKEIMAIPAADERWENWLQFVQGLLVPSFTENGFMLVQTPPHVHAKLRKALDDSLEDWDSIPHEEKIDVIYNRPLQTPKFVHVGELARWVNKEMVGIHEEWIGHDIKLKPTSAYGIRLYLNGSSLVMHYDKIETHVVSCIVHVGHEYTDDNEPWPIQIEDHDGDLHEVNLEPGQMLFYESASSLHGRMKVFNGKYYAGIFVHYQPVDTKNVWPYTHDDVIGAIPPHWRNNITEDRGSRYSGAGMTIDSRVCENAPPRVVDLSSPSSYGDEL